MNKDLLGSVVYAILNEKLKMIYIGETTRSFIVRFVEHLSSSKTWCNEKKTILMLDDSTEFRILNQLDYRGSAGTYVALETHYCELYKREGYDVINRYNTPKKLPRRRRNIKKPVIVNNESLNAYRRCFKIMVLALADKNNITTREVYTWCYKDISKKFNIYIQNREGNTMIEKLQPEELEYIVLRLFNRYKEYILNKQRLIQTKNITNTF